MGIPTLIKTLTASGDSSLSFVDGTSDVVLDSTYDEYMFVMTDINLATDNTDFQFNLSTDSGSNYNATKTTTAFHAYHNEAGTDTILAYAAPTDLAQGTGHQSIGLDMGNGSDESGAGILHVFSPASTTYVKHFYSRFQEYHQGNYSLELYIAGYANTTSAVDAITFLAASGNFDGVIQMYGIS
jgi:hypothetical protein